MTLNPFLLMMLLLAAAFGLTAVFLSPAVIELKKPKDQGPRRIPKMSMEKRIRHAGQRFPRFEPCQTRCSNNGSELQDVLKEIGVKATKIGSETLHIFGNHTFPSHSVISIDVVVEGSLKIGDDCVFHRSVKAKDTTFIGNRVVIEGNLVSEGDVTMLDDVVIGGSVHSEGSVTMGEKAFVASSVVAIGNVELGENSEVKGGIFTRGTIRGSRHANVELSSSIDEIE